MVAPQIIFIERLHLGINGNDAGTGGVDGQSGNLVSRNVRRRGGLARSFRERANVILVALRARECDPRGSALRGPDRPSCDAMRIPLCRSRGAPAPYRQW